MIIIPSESKHFKYFTGFEAAGCYLIKKNWKDKGLIMSSLLEHTRVRKLWDNVKLGRTNDIIKELKNRKVKTVSIPFDVSYNLISKIKGFGGSIKDCEQEIWNLRMIKTHSEIRKIKKAEKVCFELIDKIENLIQKLTETELSKWIKKRLLDLSDGASFEPIVAYDRNTIYPHHTPTNKRCKSLALIDFGAKYKGYCSDITIMIGLTTKYSMIIDNMMDVWDEIKKEIRPGVTSSKIAKAADKYIAEHFPSHDRMIHSLGHSIGMDVHEFPTINRATNIKIKKGMVFALEPAVYLKNYGIRIEREIYL